MKNRTDIKVILTHFEKNCPELCSIVAQIDFETWFDQEILDEKQIYKSICRTIVGQQLAGKAADAIYVRFENLLQGEVIPEKLLKIDPELIRGAGLSWAKVRSVIDLSTRVINKDLVLEDLPDMEDEKLIEKLSEVKGIGRWTAEMFLMFRLGREDIFSWGDLGLKNGLKKFLGKEEIIREEVEPVVALWSPFRTYGAIAMWHLLDNR